jgi:hypothetical protein
MARITAAMQNVPLAYLQASPSSRFGFVGHTLAPGEMWAGTEKPKIIQQYQ